MNVMRTDGTLNIQSLVLNTLIPSQRELAGAFRPFTRWRSIASAMG
jgi:hypothetical protein